MENLHKYENLRRDVNVVVEGKSSWTDQHQHQTQNYIAFVLHEKVQFKEILEQKAIENFNSDFQKKKLYSRKF